MNATKFAEITSYHLNDNHTAPVDAVETLHQDGVVCIRNVFDSNWLNVVERGISKALNGASTDVDIVKRKNDTGSFSVSSGAWMQVDEFRKFIFDSHVTNIAWSLLNTKQLVLFYDFLLIKQAKSDSAATPWHQDHSYYPLDGKKIINSWTALDDIPLETSLRFLKESHKSGTLYRAVDFDNATTDYRHARKELPLPPGTNDNSSNILSTELKAGDMLVWTSYTLHSAPGNWLNRRRAAFSVNWLGDDIVFNGKPSLETYRAPGQVVGQPVICYKFPLVRGAQ